MSDIEGLIDALGDLLAAGYGLLGLMVFFIGVGLLRPCTVLEQRRVGLFLAGIFIPAGASFFFDFTPPQTVASLVVRILAAWGVCLWWILHNLRMSRKGSGGGIRHMPDEPK